MFSCMTLLIFDGYCEQKTLQNKLSGHEYLVTGCYCKCGRNRCPKFPIFGRYNLNLVISPKAATEFVIFKVRKR